MKRCCGAWTASGRTSAPRSTGQSRAGRRSARSASASNCGGSGATAMPMRRGEAGWRAILALDGVAGHPLEEELLFGAGLLATDQRDYAAARESFETALAISTAMGREVGTSGILAQLGRLAHINGDFVTARAQLEESLAIRRRHGLRWHIAVITGLARRFVARSREDRRRPRRDRGSADHRAGSRECVDD